MNFWSAQRGKASYPEWLRARRDVLPAATRRLSDEEIARFRRDGFLAIDDVTTQEELGPLCEAYDRLFSEGRGWKDGSLFDMAGLDDTPARAALPQLLNPSRYEAMLRNTLFHANALAMCRQLLGDSAGLVFEHAILKPPRVGGATPWHQDEAFYERYTNYRAITVWMALQPTNPENGCMQYIPGSHREPLWTHRSVNDDPRIHGLEAVGVDTEAAVLCPLPAGGATFHDCRTLHGAGPNLSDQPRRAYALGFGKRGQQYTQRTEHAWNAEKRTLRQRREAETQGTVRGLAEALKTRVKALIR